MGWNEIRIGEWSDLLREFDSLDVKRPSANPYLFRGQCDARWYLGDKYLVHLKRTKKASETYPLKLTQHQRETLIRCTQLSRKLKKKIERAGN